MTGGSTKSLQGMVQLQSGRQGVAGGGYEQFSGAQTKFLYSIQEAEIERDLLWFATALHIGNQTFLLVLYSWRRHHGVFLSSSPSVSDALCWNAALSSYVLAQNAKQALLTLHCYAYYLSCACCYRVVLFACQITCWFLLRIRGSLRQSKLWRGLRQGA